MDARQIAALGPRLRRFLSEFADGFGRREARDPLRTYVAGQLSNRPRQSVEPIALAGGTPPRTRQRFLESIPGDERRLRDQRQRVVVRDPAHPQAIGVIDESGNPPKGRRIAAVQHPGCGNPGNVDPCVVAVHVGDGVEDFPGLLDRDWFLPQDGANDPQRRAAAFLPEEGVDRQKTNRAWAPIERAPDPGIRVAAGTFDECYGREGEFLDGLEALGPHEGGEVPSTFTGTLSADGTQIVGSLHEGPTPRPVVFTRAASGS